MGIFEILGDYRFLAFWGFVTSFACLGLGILVLRANPRSKSCRLTFFFNFFVAMWSFFYGLMFIAGNNLLGVIATQNLTVGTVMLCVTFTHLVLVVLKKEKKFKPLLYADYAISTIFVLALYFTNIIVDGIKAKLDFPSYTEGGPLYILVPFYLFMNLFFSLYHLTQGIKTSTGYKKNQLTLFLIGISIGFAAGTAGFLLVLNIPVKPVTSPLVVIYPLLVAYAIIKHRFLDIRKLVKNTLIFSLLFMLLLGCVSFVLLVFRQILNRWIGISDILSQALAIALAIACYDPLKAGLSKLTNRLLFQKNERPDVILRRLSEDMLHCLDADQLAAETVNRIAGILALDHIALYARSVKTPYLFELRQSFGAFRKKELHQSHPIIHYLETDDEMLISRMTRPEARLERRRQHFFLSGAKDIKKSAAIELAALNGVAAFPVTGNGTLRAVLIAGSKKSDAPWQEQEFMILKSFVWFLSLAFANAEYAQAIRRSRDHLLKCERDASAGTLIAGIEHEVKGPVQSILLAEEVVKKYTSAWKTGALPREELLRVLARKSEQILEDTAKIDAIMRELSNLAENRSIEIRDLLRPEELTRRVLRELGKSIPLDEIRMTVEFPPQLSVTGSSNALYEILTNLLRNAAQAIDGSGTITVRGYDFSTEAIIEVEDSGIGISAENLQKIFEPYFTTKKSLQRDGTTGTGMGLFIVREYMREMGAQIQVDSAPGRGTLFRLHFFKNPEPAGRAA